MRSIVCRSHVVVRNGGDVEAVTLTLRAISGPLLMTSIFHEKPRASAVGGARIDTATSAPVWASAAVERRGKRTKERRGRRGNRRVMVWARYGTRNKNVPI